MPRYAYAALTVAVVTAVAMAGCAPRSGPTVTRADEAVPSVAQVNPGDIVAVEAIPVPSGAVLGGTVIPLREVTLAAEAPGRIRYLAGREGDRFSAGDVLVAISEDELRAQRHAAVAELARAQYAMANAYVQYQRELYAPRPPAMGGMGMPWMFDQMFTRPMANAMGLDNSPVDRHADVYQFGTVVAQAQAAVDQARSRIAEIDSRLRDTRSVAPFAGVIVHKLVETGDPVQPGMPLLRIAETSRLQVQVEVPARLMPRLRKGMLIPARLDVGNTAVQARVAQIFPMADEQRHTVTVKLDLPAGVPGGPGMYAEVTIPEQAATAETVPVVPDSAVVWRGSLPAVYVVDRDNRPALRLIRTGERIGRGIQVLSGLRAGERVVARPENLARLEWGSGAPRS